MNADVQQIRLEMQRLTNEQLLRVVTTDSAGYRPEALEVAREILRSRDIVDQSPEAYEAARAASDVRDHEPRIMGRRFANFILDLVLFEIISTLVVFMVLDTGTERVALALIFFLVMFLLYFVFEATLQRTPAKFLTGTIVIAVDGSRPTPGAIAIRTISRFVPFEPLSFGRWGLAQGSAGTIDGVRRG
ncbi:MAG: RDD family protein [Acidobacteria bacterium]|nr:RDD family protein [Acidobacteriota bacterium]